MTVGQRIKKYRELLGMSQEALAIKMGYKDRSSVSKIEKYPDEKITIEIVYKVSEILKCSPLLLLGMVDANEVEDSQVKRLIHYFNLLSSTGRQNAELYLKYLADQEKQTENDK